MGKRGVKARGVGLAGVAALVAIAIALPGAAAETPPVVEIPEAMVPELTSRLNPNVLPRREDAPVSLSLEGKFRTRDGSIPPALRKIEFLGDKFVSLDLEGIPACGPKGVPNAPPPWKKCKDAIVGRGKAEILIAYPENTPLPYTSDLVVYNGGMKEGVARLWVHGFSPIRIPRAVVVPVLVKKTKKERYGWKGEARIPPISEGAAAIIAFNLTLQRRILSARCPDGKHQARFDSTFADGTGFQAFNVGACTGR